MLSFDNFVVEMRSRDGRVVFLDVLSGIRLYTALAFKFRSSALLSSVSGSDTRMKMPFDAAFLTTNTHSGFPLYRPQSCLSKYNAHYYLAWTVALLSVAATALTSLSRLTASRGLSILAVPCASSHHGHRRHR